MSLSAAVRSGIFYKSTCLFVFVSGVCQVLVANRKLLMKIWIALDFYTKLEPVMQLVLPIEKKDQNSIP